MEVVVQQIQQTTTTKVVDKQPAAVNWSSTTSNLELKRFLLGYCTHEGSGDASLMADLSLEVVVQKPIDLRTTTSL